MKESSLKLYTASVLAGFCIGLGGYIFLSVDNKIIGSFLFGIGLFVICTNQLALYTGKVCYAIKENNLEYTLSLIYIWLGNLVGTALCACMIQVTRTGVGVSYKAEALWNTKCNDNLVSLFFLGFLCNIFIFIAVNGYKNGKNSIVQIGSIFLGVMGFILCGTEHCVADMFYMFLADKITVSTILRLIIITIGNSLGGIYMERLFDHIKTE